MRSTSGEHFVGLDHIRALAAFLVVCWHFNHDGYGYPVPYGVAPLMPPFAVIDEGHTGVALFMCLSGYLFAKLLNGKRIHFTSFLWNRALRLLPLLVVVILLHAVMTLFADGDLARYWKDIAMGVVMPTLPSGGWSITTEFHFYLILPLLLWLATRGRALPLVVVAFALAARALIWIVTGEVWSLAYWTIIGRIDQFTFGIVAYYFSGFMKGRHGIAAAVIVIVCAVFYGIDRSYKISMVPEAATWIWLATFEAFAYSVLIAWYDSSFQMRNAGVSRLIGLVGAYSYSIYLLHVFFYDRVAGIVHRHVVPLSNIYSATAGALCFLLGMAVIGHFSFVYIEAPFLKHRRRYVGTSIKI